MNTASLQRATVPLLLLALIEKGSAHGYAISKELRRRGFAPITGAQLYPALSRLEEAGQIEASWEPQDAGPARKVYSITSEGKIALQEDRGVWRGFVELVADVLSGVGSPRS